MLQKLQGLLNKSIKKSQNPNSHPGLTLIKQEEEEAIVRKGILGCPKGF